MSTNVSKSVTEIMLTKKLSVTNVFYIYHLRKTEVKLGNHNNNN